MCDNYTTVYMYVADYNKHRNGTETMNIKYMLLIVIRVPSTNLTFNLFLIWLGWSTVAVPKSQKQQWQGQCCLHCGQELFGIFNGAGLKAGRDKRQSDYILTN